MSQQGTTLSYTRPNVIQGQPDNNRSPLASPSRATLSMDELRDICGPIALKSGLTPLNGFQIPTGLTPRIGQQYPTGLTPKGFDFNTPRFDTKDKSFTPSKVGLAEPLPLPRHDNGVDMNNYSFGYDRQMYVNYHQQQPQQQQQQQQQVQPQQMQQSPDAYEKTPKKEAKLEEELELDARRRMKNRERVRKCRKRKQDRLAYLEARNIELEQENEKLRSGKMIKTEDKTVDQAMIKSQDDTIERIRKAINGGYQAISSNANNVWLQNAVIIHGCNGLKSVGLENMLQHEKGVSEVFSSYKAKVLDISREGLTPSKVRVTWEIEVQLESNSTSKYKTLAPFFQLSEFIAGEKVSFKQVSYITFNGDKISEEIRIIDSLALLSSILGKSRRHGPSSVTKITQIIVNSS